jgi:hypothetical protein
MEEFLRRRTVSVSAGRFAAALSRGRATARHHVYRGTVAKKAGHLTAAKNNDTSAETNGGPQTPAEPR